jgi:single stranded DNA-binding protein
MAINEVRIQGGLTREPEFGYGAATGTPYWKTTLANNTAKYDATERRQVVQSTFISVVAFGWKAEQMMELGLGKGDELFVRGELDQSSWENKETGKDQHKTQVRIESFDVVRRTGSRQSAPQASATATATATVIQPPPGEDPWALPPRHQDPEPPF